MARCNYHILITPGTGTVVDNANKASASGGCAHVQRRLARQGLAAYLCSLLSAPGSLVHPAWPSCVFRNSDPPANSSAHAGCSEARSPSDCVNYCRIAIGRRCCLRFGRSLWLAAVEAFEKALRLAVGARRAATVDDQHSSSQGTYCVCVSSWRRSSLGRSCRWSHYSPTLLLLSELAKKDDFIVPDFFIINTRRSTLLISGHP